MKILVTGANGQLGRSIRRIADSSVNNYIFTDIADLDITDRQDLDEYITKHGPFGVIVNCAAYTNVDRAESEPDLALKINCHAVRNLAEIAAKTDSTLIHISTDYVFDGTTNTPIPETEIANSQNVYGSTKLLGEKAVMESGCKYLILRTAWLYSEYGKNFVKTIRQKSRESDCLNIVYDQVGSPTYAGDLAAAIVSIIENNRYKGREGIYHYVNDGVCSWFDLGKMITLFSDNRTCVVRPCRSTDYPSAVKRPAYSVLDNAKIKKTFGITIPYWFDSLVKCLNNLKDE